MPKFILNEKAHATDKYIANRFMVFVKWNIIFCDHSRTWGECK